MATVSLSSLVVVAMVLLNSCSGQEDYQAAPQAAAEAPGPQYSPQPQQYSPPPQQYSAQPQQFNSQPSFGQFGGNHELFLATLQAQQLFNNQGGLHQAPVQHDDPSFQNQFPSPIARSGGGGSDDQQLVTKVFVKPDGGIATIQVPQNFNFRR